MATKPTPKRTKIMITVETDVDIKELGQDIQKFIQLRTNHFPIIEIKSYFPKFKIY